MNKLLFIILFSFSFNLFAQIPETEDSIYWSGNYCDTAETAEDALDQWIWSGNEWVLDCIQTSQLFVDAFTDEFGNVTFNPGVAPEGYGGQAYDILSRLFSEDAGFDLSEGRTKEAFDKESRNIARDLKQAKEGKLDYQNNHNFQILKLHYFLLSI